MSCNVPSTILVMREKGEGKAAEREGGGEEKKNSRDPYWNNWGQISTLSATIPGSPGRRKRKGEERKGKKSAAQRWQSHPDFRMNRLSKKKGKEGKEKKREGTRYLDTTRLACIRAERRAYTGGGKRKRGKGKKSPPSEHMMGKGRGEGGKKGWGKEKKET